MQTTTPADARGQYRSEGFAIAAEPILPQDVVSRAVDGMDAIRRSEYDTGGPPQPSHWNPGDDPNELCKIEMPQFASRAIMDLVSHRDLGAWAAGVTGARMVQVWWVQLLYKPVGEPSGQQNVNIGWHQDRHYWRTWEEGSELFTAWVALSDVTRDAGPMRFVRGSHRWGLVDKGGFYEQDLEAQRQDIQPPPGERWEEVAAILSPGGASLHHNLTLHGSGPNASEGPRRSLAIHLRTEKSRPVEDRREGLTQFIDDPSRCPIIFGRPRP